MLDTMFDMYCEVNLTMIHGSSPFLATCKLSLYCCVLCRKVYLGYKKSNPCKKYAIKVMKKVDMINKNMASQGIFPLCCD